MSSWITIWAMWELTEHIGKLQQKPLTFTSEQAADAIPSRIRKRIRHMCGMIPDKLLPSVESSTELEHDEQSSSSQPNFRPAQ